MIGREHISLSNHIKVPTKRKGDNHSSYFLKLHGRFRVISALRSPFKLKIFNYSHRHSIEFIVHQGSAIEVMISENFFIIFHCGLIHSETLSWFI